MFIPIKRGVTPFMISLGAAFLMAECYFALTENNVYLIAAFNDYWIFSKSRGNIIE